MIAKEKLKQTKPKQHPYIVTVHGSVPITISFHVVAESEEEAYKVYENNPFSLQQIGAPKIEHNKLQKHRIDIRSTTSILVSWVKKFL